MGMLNSNLSKVTISFPHLLAKFKNYTPKKIHRAAVDSDDLILSGEPFYGVDADIACQQQVQQYLTKPIHFSLHYPSVPPSFAEHQNTINRLNDKAQSLGFPLKAPNSSSLIVLGAGLGFHLLHLIKARTFSSIVLLEPDEDMLFHFLSNINVEEVSHHCKKNGGEFAILTAKSLPEFSKQILHFAKQVGFGFFAELGLYRHYETPLFNKIFDDFVPTRQQWLSTWGFFDDEIIGLTHSLNNVSCGAHIFTQPLSKPTEKPVVVIGNGPSLDTNLPLLKNNRSKFIVASCGTALAALVRNGITPDVHVEMERTEGSYNLCRPWLSDAMLEKSVLFALNTVTPKITQLFSNTLLFAKANDSGTSLLTMMNDKPIHELYFCNPTVTNFAISSFITLGFKDVILLGCDYGFKDPGKHHSASSDYFDKTNSLSKQSYKIEYEVMGNFGGKVGTDRIYNLARINVEQLLIRNPDVKCRNSSDGAFIKGTSAVTFKNIVAEYKTKEDICGVIKLLDTTGFKPMQVSPKVLNERFDSSLLFLNQLKNAMTSRLDGSQMLQTLSELTSKVEQTPKNNIEFYLFSGVLRYLSVTLTSHLTRLPESAHAEYLNFYSRQLIQLCEHSLDSIKNLLNNQKEQVNEV